MSSTILQKHALEDHDSWSLHLERLERKQQQQQQRLNGNNNNNNHNDANESTHAGLRRLNHHHHQDHQNHHNHQNHQHHHHKQQDDFPVPPAVSDDAVRLEEEREHDFWTQYKHEQHKNSKKERLEHEALLKSVYANPGIAQQTVHGLMIDAGSTGSRLHVYEWEPRVLTTPEDIQAAVSGALLSFPGTESRWTDRLRPGLAEFAAILHPDETEDDSDDSDEDDDDSDDDEISNTTTTTSSHSRRTDDEINAQLDEAITKYMQPLLEFAQSVLHSKRHDFASFPIYLRATAGMRILNAADRARVMASVRRVLRQNTTMNPFGFHRDEQARTLSGEEEAIYDWAGVNFLVGDLVPQTKGAGTVVHPKRMHGALDLGGGSTQISFFEPTQDIMSNLFKLQIGQAKHWNVYAHSFLFYGMNEALHRHGARLAAGKSSRERIVNGVYDPCMPKGSKVDIRTNIHLKEDGVSETWMWYNQSFPSGNGYYQATLYNDGQGPNATARVNATAANATAVVWSFDLEKCFAMAKDLLHLEKNEWCNFAHKGDCSFAGIYQPQLPEQNTETFGEFIAFSNYYHVWKFLDLPPRASIQELYDATKSVCAMDWESLQASSHSHKIEATDLPTYCFRSVYVFHLLRHGFGFGMNDTILVGKVLNGQKVGWALGSMLYEINTLPWTYALQDGRGTNNFALGSGCHGAGGRHHYGYRGHVTAATLTAALVPLSMVVMIVCAVALVFYLRWRRMQLYRQHYEPVKNHCNSNSSSSNSVGYRGHVGNHYNNNNHTTPTSETSRLLPVAE
ncbi:hypothetical protein ACA910_021274 [Epithemia clementina (nom. ined.)]